MKDVKAHHTTRATLTEICTALPNFQQIILVEQIGKLVEFVSLCVAALIKGREDPIRY